MSSNPISDYLMERRVLLLEGPIDRCMLKELRNRMLLLEQHDPESPITLEIDCEGGDTFPTLHFCDFLELRLKAPVHGIVTGLCASSATFILLHCSKRSGFPNSHYLIHSTALGNLALKTNQASRAVRKQLNADMDATHDQVTSMYMRKLDMNRKEIEKLTSRGEQSFNAEMRATEALSIGLIEEIITNKS